jgi:uncharacterized delta-60 repeat protein
MIFFIQLSSTVDSRGNVCVTGYSVGDGTNYDFATVKYDPNGNQLWVARYNGPGNGIDGARAVTADSAGNVYVTGAAYMGISTSYDYTTIKYNPSGNPMWIATYNGPGNGSEGARAIAVDSAGNVYITGESYGGPSTGFDYATIKYNQNGNQVWVARYNGPASGADRAKALAIDSAGNVYVSGYSTGSGTGYDYTTIKYNQNGNLVWLARYNGPGNGADTVTAMVKDSAGNVYVTGESYGGVSTGYDYATVKYDPNGNHLWAARYDGPRNGMAK